jgi:hypothetical protein
MRRPYLVLATAAGLSLAVGASAEAAGRGGGTAPFAPPGLQTTNQGFTSSNGVKGDHIIGATSPSQTTGYGPSGWSQGTQGTGDTWKTLSSSPPGLSK